MWCELHRHALAYSGDVLAELAWLYRWHQGVIACGGCLEHWLAFIAQYPPDLRSAETYFGWSVAAHNTVTARRGGTDLWSVDQAEARWQSAEKPVAAA